MNPYNISDGQITKHHKGLSIYAHYRHIYNNYRCYCESHLDNKYDNHMRALAKLIEQKYSKSKLNC